MAESGDSSGLLSLRALHQHEAERSRKQAEEARAQAEAEQQARVLAERQRAREAARRMESERGSQGSAEAARRAELAELESGRAAERQRADREASARRDLEVCVAEERNTRRQAEILLLAQAARARLQNWLSGALCLLTWLATAGLYLGLVRPDSDRSRLALGRALAGEQRAVSEAQALDARARQRQAALLERVSSLEQALRDAQAAPIMPPAGASGKHARQIGAHTARNVAPHGPCNDNGDPLDPCLGQRPSPPKRAPQ